jgi:hypothetical protein
MPLHQDLEFEALPPTDPLRRQSLAARLNLKA